MAEIAGVELGSAVHFEISVTNVDKNSLTVAEIERRLHQFDSGAVIWVTRAATFLQKARLFARPLTFVVGADTLARLADPQYLQPDGPDLPTMWQEFSERDCRFLVFGRRAGAGLVTVDNLALPEVLRDRCQQVPIAEFCLDISSSQLRQSGRLRLP